MKRHVIRISLVLAVFAAALPSLRASDLIGVYGIVDRVEHSGSRGTRGAAVQKAGIVQIWGTFVVAVPPPQDVPNYAPSAAYSAPKKGYLLYACPPGRLDVCTAEWNDLASVAGTGKIVGFSARTGYANTVHPAAEPSARPDIYRLNTGVVRIGTPSAAFKDLFAALQQVSARP
jgi:hypothetical protein